jgi:hypothetical protein
MLHLAEQYIRRLVAVKPVPQTAVTRRPGAAAFRPEQAPPG